MTNQEQLKKLDELIDRYQMNVAFQMINKDEGMIIYKALVLYREQLQGK